MKFAIPVEVQPLNVVTDTAVTIFDNNVHMAYPQGLELQSNNKVYVRSGPYLYPPNYTSAEDTNYVVNDIVFKDGKVQWCTAPIAQVPKLPYEYTAFDNSLDFSTFSQRYSIIGTQTDGVMTASINNIGHKLYPDVSSETGWAYELTKTVQEDYWGLGQFSESSDFWVRVTKGTGQAQAAEGVWWNDVVFNGTVEVIIINNPGGTISYIVEQKEFAGTDGRDYKVGGVAEVGSSDLYCYIHRQETKNVQVVSKFRPVVVTNIVEGDVENLAVCYNPSNCAAEWYPRFIYLQPGGNVWVRTDQMVITEYKTLTSPTFQIINSLIEANGWGWTYARRL